MFPRKNLCSHAKTYVPTQKPMFPRKNLCSHAKTYVPTQKPMFPRKNLCSHAKTYVPTQKPMFPRKNLCSHAKTYVPTQKPMFPRKNLCSHAKTYVPTQRLRTTKSIFVRGLMLISPPTMSFPVTTSTCVSGRGKKSALSTFHTQPIAFSAINLCCSLCDPATHTLSLATVSG